MKVEASLGRVRWGGEGDALGAALTHGVRLGGLVRVVPRLAVGHIANALGRLLLPVLPLCWFSVQSVRLPYRAAVALWPPKRRQLRPGPPGPATLRPRGGEGAGSGDPPTQCTDTLTVVAFPESPYRAPNFPLGKGLSGLSSVCLAFCQGGSLSFPHCKMGTSSVSVWSRNKFAAR